MTQNTAVLAGATGLVGSYLLQVLLEDAFYDRVIALARKPMAVSHSKLTTVITDYSALTPDQLPGATHLFCCLGTTIKKAGSREAFRKVDYEYPLAFAHAGKAAGAKHYSLVSSVEASPRSSTFYLRVKGELEEQLVLMGFESLHLFRPSILMGKREEMRPKEQFGIRFIRAVEWMLAGSMQKFRPMPAGALAAAMAAAGERGADGHHVHHYTGILEMARY